MDNDFWVKERQREIIDGKIRRELGPDPVFVTEIKEHQNPRTSERVQNGYNPLEGLVIYLDFLLNLKEDTD